MNPVPITALSLPEAGQQLYLEQLVEHQQALKQLLDQQPEAGKVLADVLLANVKAAFPGHSLDVAPHAVTVDEAIRFDCGSGRQMTVQTEVPPRPLTTLFTRAPWGGENVDAPNRVYRFSTKVTYTERDATTADKLRTVTGTLGSIPAFNTFMDQLIRRPDQYFQQQLDSFWSGAFPSQAPLTRRQWLADRLARVALAEAALRVEDATLDEAAKTLVGQIVSHPASQAREHLPMHLRPAALALSLKGRNNKPDIALIGLFVLSGKTTQSAIEPHTDLGAVLLFTPGRGIDAFASLLDLDQSLRAQLANEEARESFLDNAHWQDRARARRYLKSAPTFLYSAIHEHLFEHNVSTLLALQKHDIEYGWRLTLRHEVDEKHVHELFNRLAHIGSFLDLRGLLTERGLRYLESTLPSWYQTADPMDKQALKQLSHVELKANTVLATQFQAAAIPALLKFAGTELSRQLEIDYPNRGIDPDKVTVSITTRFNPASLGGGPGPDHVPIDHPTSRPTHVVELTLTEFALKNNAPWDFSLYKLFTGERRSISASGTGKSGERIRFDEDYLKALVKNLDVSTGYDQLLSKRLIEQGTHLAIAWGDAYLANLNTQLQVARMNTGSFLQDIENRGYRWVEAISESFLLSTYKTVGGHKIVASELLIGNDSQKSNDYPLEGVLVISVERRRAVRNVVVFTPSHPSGQDFREFADNSAMEAFFEKQWQTSGEWRDYLLQHVPAQGKEWIAGARNQIFNPFDTLYLQTIKPPVCAALYEQKVRILRQNANHASTSNAEVEHQSLWNKITFGVDLAMDVLSFLPITRAFNALRNVTRTVLLLKQADQSKSMARALWSITGARGRPIVPPRRDAVPVFRSAPDLSGMEVNVDPLTLDRIKGSLFQSKTSTQQYARFNGKLYLSDVAQGQRFIHPPGAAGNTLRYPLIMDKSLKNWQVEPKLRLPGGNDPIEKGPLQTTYLDYELPAADLAVLPAVNTARTGTFSLGSLHQSITISDHSAAVLHLFGIQARLRRHARHYFRQFVAPSRTITLPPRHLDADDVFNHLLSQRNGLVFGEHHTFSLTREFLIKNVASLKRQGVAGFYVEMLNTDMHQALLNLYNASPTAQLPALIRERLVLMGGGATHHFHYVQLLEAVHAQGIPIFALDATASSLYKAGDLTLRTSLTLADRMERLTLFNFFACKKITFDQASRGSHRWVALVGSGHCNTLQGIPGLAELTDATGIRVIARISQQSVARITRDPGSMMSSSYSTHDFTLKCDLLLCLPSDTNTHKIANRLHGPDMFTTLRTRTGESQLRYMNAQHQHVDVRVLEDAGQVYVDHDPFGALSSRRFPDLDALTEAMIDDLGMIEV